MAEFTYTIVPGKIKNIFGKIRDTGLPPKVHNQWLAQIGFGSSNDRSVIRVLKQLHFIDKTGIPQQTWKDYRGTNHGQVLAQAIRTGYPELFHTYPDAQARSVAELEAFFRNNTDGGKEVISKLVATFKALVEIATFTSLPTDVPEPVETPEPDVITPAKNIGKGSHVAKGLNFGVPAININIQLTLPESTDEHVYTALFSAMRRYLFVTESDE